MIDTDDSKNQVKVRTHNHELIHVHGLNTPLVEVMKASYLYDYIIVFLDFS